LDLGIAGEEARAVRDIARCIGRLKDARPKGRAMQRAFLRTPYLAIANKLARIVFAMMTTGEGFRGEIFAKA